MAPFDIPYTTFYWSFTVNIALSCTVFELFGDEIWVRSHSRSSKLVAFKSLGMVSIVTVALSCIIVCIAYRAVISSMI